MWRFFNNFSRVFRQHVYNPRPSAGLYVEEEESFERTDARKRRNSVDENESASFCPQNVLNRLFVGYGASREDEDETGKQGTNREWWKARQSELWHLLHGSHRMLEAITWGSAAILGRDVDSYKRKTRLLYRVLFAVSGRDGPLPLRGILNLENNLTLSTSASFSSSIHHGEQRLAIKDAEGAAHDAEINTRKEETLDSAMEEFQSVCKEYTAKNQSLLGLLAAKEGDMAAAVDHLKSSCMLGNSSACFNLGLCYETGTGVLQDEEKAMYYYEKAAKSGHSMALYNLGLMCLNASSEFEDRAEVTDSSHGDRSRGISLIEQAAMLGLPEALTYMGIHHIDGNQDAEKALPYFQAASAKNDSEAQYYLAVCYEQGLGVDVNECRAAQLYSLAASAGHDLAIYNLAVFNQYGLGGLPQDETSARLLYTKAAQMGLSTAEERLCEMDESKIRKRTELSTEDYEIINGMQSTHSLLHHSSASTPNLGSLVQSYYPPVCHTRPRNFSHRQQEGYNTEMFDPGGVKLSSLSADQQCRNSYVEKFDSVDVFNFDNKKDQIICSKNGVVFGLGDPQEETLDVSRMEESSDDESCGFSPRSRCSTDNSEESSEGEALFPVAQYDMLRSQSYPSFSMAGETCRVCN